MGKLFFQDNPSWSPQNVTRLILSACLLNKLKIPAYRSANCVSTESGKLSGYGFMVGLLSNFTETSAVGIRQGFGNTEISNSVNMTFTSKAANISIAVSICRRDGDSNPQCPCNPTASILIPFFLRFFIILIAPSLFFSYTRL